MRKVAMIVLGCIALSLSGGVAEPGKKPIWAMTESARAAERYDRLASRVRRARAISEGYQVTAGENDVFVIGRHNPELIMGFELMQTLVAYFEPDSPFGSRVRPRWTQAGTDRFGSDFWNRLSEVVRPVIEAGATAKSRMPDDDPSGTRLCALRADALSQARQVFGREEFDAFLYEVVAPDVGPIISSASAPDFLVDAAMWQDGGCR